MCRPRLTAALLLSIAAIGCASSELALPPPPPPAVDECPYRRVWVQPDNNWVGLPSIRVERARRQAVLRAIESFEHYRLARVERREDAYWVLQSNGFTDSNGDTNIRFGLAPELKLAQHLFLVMMDDPSFPYRGTLGSGVKLFLPAGNTASLNPSVDRGMESIWRDESGLLAALCEARERLVREGLAEIEDLRDQLVEEMQRLRRERAARQRKHLDVTVEPDDELRED